MKKILFVLVLLLLSLSVFGQFKNAKEQYVKYPNLLTNPGFEQGKKGWSNSAGTFTVDSASLHGAKAGKVVLSSQTLALTNNLTNIKFVGQTLGVSCFIKSTVPVSLCSTQAGSEVKCSDAASADNYTEYQTTMVGLGAGTMGLKIKTAGSTSGTIYVDGCTLDNKPTDTAAYVSFQSVSYDNLQGFGSTNTKIPYFNTKNNGEKTGSLFTYENSSTNGFSVTALRECLVNIHYTMGNTSGSAMRNGFTINSSSLTTNFSSITSADKLGETYASTSVDATVTVSLSIVLQKGDILRPHTNGVSNFAGAYTGMSVSATASNAAIVNSASGCSLDNNPTASIANSGSASVTAETCNPVTTAVRNSPGNVTVTYNSDVITETPVVSVGGFGDGYCCSGTPGSSSITVQCRSCSNDAVQDIPFSLSFTKQGDDYVDPVRTVIASPIRICTLTGEGHQATVAGDLTIALTTASNSCASMGITLLSNQFTLLNGKRYKITATGVLNENDSGNDTGNFNIYSTTDSSVLFRGASLRKYNSDYIPYPFIGDTGVLSKNHTVEFRLTWSGTDGFVGYAGDGYSAQVIIEEY